jgi:type IV pilus biogenesis protein CpaD/CtpE
MFAARHRLIAVVVVLAACATNSPPVADNGAAPADRVTKNPLIISTEELQDPVIASTDALTAIRQLRPAFFRDRGPTTFRNVDPAQAPGLVRVSQDFGQPQQVSVLSGISTRSLVEVRYLNTNEAQARFGINANGGPVIVVLTIKQ